VSQWNCTADHLHSRLNAVDGARQQTADFVIVVHVVSVSNAHEQNVCRKTRQLLRGHTRPHIYDRQDKHSFNGLFSSKTWQAGTRKVKPIWILMKQEIMGLQRHQLDHMHLITQYLQAGCSFWCPINSVKAEKAKQQTGHNNSIAKWLYVLFCSLAFLDPRVGHTMDVLSPFISLLCHSDWLFHRESCPWLDVVYPGRAWSSSPECTWHCALHYFFLQAIPLFPHGVTIVC